MILTDKKEHTKQILDYLKDTNLSPFKMYVDNSLLHIEEVKVEVVADSPIERLVLINKDEIKKDKSGYLEFSYRKVNFRYFNPNVWRGDMTSKKIDAIFEDCHVYEEYVVKEYEYDKWWKELFWGHYEKTDEYVYIDGCVYEKDRHGPMDRGMSSKRKLNPIKTEEEKGVYSNNYYLTLLKS